jgi:hypothetical protein
MDLALNSPHINSVSLSQLLGNLTSIFREDDVGWIFFLDDAGWISIAGNLTQIRRNGRLSQLSTSTRSFFFKINKYYRNKLQK